MERRQPEGTEKDGLRDPSEETEEHSLRDPSEETKEHSLRNPSEGTKGDGLRYPPGLRWTRQRKSVYKALWEAKEPLSAVQILRLTAQDGGEGYALSTVYRILAAFEENGMAEKTAWMEDGTAAYSLNRGEHTHFAVCLECRRRIPLRNCPISGIHLEQETEDFVVTGHKLELYGYCSMCKKKEKQEKITKRIEK